MPSWLSRFLVKVQARQGLSLLPACTSDPATHSSMSALVHHYSPVLCSACFQSYGGAVTETTLLGSHRRMN